MAPKRGYDPELGQDLQQAFVSGKRKGEHGQLAKYVSEFLGVYFLVLTIGCNVHTESVGTALSAGGMLAVLVFSLGAVSGGHFNPAVTLAILLRGHIDGAQAGMYVFVQMLAGYWGAVSYSLLTGGAFIFAPAFEYSQGAALSVEVLYSCLLCYVVLNVATSKDAPNQYFGLAVGFCVVTAAIACGSISGSSLNPAVSFGCLAMAAQKHGVSAVSFWALYFFAPFIGALLAWILYTWVRPEYTVAAAVPSSYVEEPAAPDLDPEVYHITKEQEAADLAVGLTYELHDPQQRGMLEIDGSCVEFDSQSRCCGAVYFADKEDAENGIIHYGLHWGDLGSYAQADDDQIRFNLSKIQPHIHVLFFVVTLFGEGHSLSTVAKCHARLIQRDGQKPSEVLKFTREFSQQEEGNVYVIAVLYRTQRGGWIWEACDKSYNLAESGTYRLLEPQLKRLLLQKKEIMSS